MPSGLTAACGAVSESRYAEMSYTIQQGLHSCRMAQLVIVDSLQHLHSSCPGQDWVIGLVYIVAKGIPIATAKCCNEVEGDVRRLHQSHIVEHVPAISDRVHIIFQENFRRDHKEVIDAVRHCAGLTDSRWQIMKPKGVAKAKASKPACGGAAGAGTSSTLPACDDDKARRRKQIRHCEVTCLNDLWKLAQELRRVRNVRTAPVVWVNDRVGM